MKKIVCLILAAALFLPAFSGCAMKGDYNTFYFGKIGAEYTIAPITSEDDYKLLQNPDRGLYFEVEYDVKKNSTMYTNDNTGPTGDLMYKYNAYKSDKPTLARVYIHLNGYKDVDIDEVGIQRIEQLFQGLRDIKVKALLTFVYQYNTNGVDGEHIGMQGDGQVNKETMYRHIEQLAPVLERNKDVISVLFAGFLGAWGEWSLYDTEEFTPSVKKTLLEKIIDMTPEESFVCVRYPKDKSSFLAPGDGRYERVGFHNDSIFGYQDANAWGSTEWDPGKPQWTLSVRESAQVPIAGELFWGWWFVNNQSQLNKLDGLSVLQQLSDMRFYAMSMAHSYKEKDTSANVNPSKWPMVQWKSEIISKEELDARNIAYAPSYFKNADGNDVERTIFEFIRDYLGYKFEIQRVRLNGNAACGKTVNVAADFVNYGYSAPFNLTSGFAVLDEEGNVVSQTEAGDPRTFHKYAADNSSLDLLTHTMQADITLPDTSGKYYIALYMKNSMDSFVRFGNQVNYLNGYNVLATVEI